MIARRIGEIGFSPTLAVSDLARKLRAEGVDVLDFSAGQPDFPTPDEVKQAAKRAIDDDQTRYTATAGIPELREGIRRRLRGDLDLDYPADQVVVSPGAKASLYFAFMTVLDPGDRLIVPSPYWTSYPEQVRLTGAEPLFVDCLEQHGFKLTAESLDRVAAEGAKAVILNYPCNPTGACYTREELRALAEVCVRHDLWVIADEIYSKLVYDGTGFTSIAQLGPEIRERTILIDGVSKSHSMTGWRIGYAAGPREVISGMAKLQSHTTSNATSISQWASRAALEMSEGDLEPRREAFEQRRDAILSRLRELPGVTCAKPEGAFYVFPNVSGCLGSGGAESVTTPQELCTYLLRAARVAAVPGEAFGSDRHLRLSYAVSLERIQEGMDRIAEALRALQA